MEEEEIEYEPIPLDAVEGVVEYFDIKYGQLRCDFTYGAMKMKDGTIKPTRNLVLCRASGERDQKTPGGLHIPDTVKGRVDRAEVLAVGEGWYTAKGVLVPCCVKPGQVVLFDPYRITWVEGVDHNVSTPAAKPGDLFLIHDDAILAEVV